MAKINVNLEAFYGYSCGCHGHGSKETIEMEVNEVEFEALQKLGTKEISCEAVINAIENGENELISLHERLEEKFYYMVEEYWLYEAYNEFLYECLERHMKQDISDGLYPPTDSEDDEDEDYYEDEDYEDDFEDDDEDDEGDDFDDDFDDEDEYFEDDFDDEDEESYDLDEYYNWVKEHDHYFVAERVGLDLGACRDDEVDYIITFSE
jgi:hypothetical protein